MPKDLKPTIQRENKSAYQRYGSIRLLQYTRTNCAALLERVNIPRRQYAAPPLPRTQ